MKTSDVGINAIKKHEGLRLKAYPDPATGSSPWTIGYGHTRDVSPGDEISEEQATALLQEDLYWAETVVTDNVVVPISQNQFDALVSLTFNIGAGAFERSTLLQKLNSGDMLGAASEFIRWNKAGGKVFDGLTKRRIEERDMFNSSINLDTSPKRVEETPKTEHVELTPQPKAKPMLPIIAALLPSLIEAIPKLGSLFGSGSEVATRNVRAAEIAFNVAKEALGAKNEQEVVEQLKADPAAVATVSKAIEENWFALTESGGGGIDGARKADAATASRGDMLHSPSFWISLLLMPMAYAIVGSIVGFWGKEWPADVRSAIANGVIGLILGAVTGYYFGQTTSRNRTPPSE